MPLKEKSDRGTTLVEFYRGLLMAVEQVKSEGVGVDVYAMDSGTTAEQMEQVLTDERLTQMDVIFGPLDAAQVPLLSDFCYRHRIRMVQPFNTPCPQVYTNPYIYQVGIAQDLLFPNICAQVMNVFPDGNFIFWHSGEEDSRASGFIEHLEQVLGLANIPTSHFTPPATGHIDYARVFSPTLNNVIVVDSRSQKALERVLTAVRECRQTSPQYKVTLLGYPEWVAYAQTLLKEFYANDTYAYSIYYRNPFSGRVLKFEQQYQKNFNQKPRESYPQPEMLGYDLGYYFLHGLAALGTNFDEKQGTLEQQPLQHSFHFQRVGELGGFINMHTQLIHYVPNNTIRVIK